jgi:hypothetical protein
MSETVIKQSSEFSVQKTTLAIATCTLPFRCGSRTMECLHGQTASYNLLEGIYANAVAHEVWNPVMVVKSVILVKSNMTVS